jgi:hypothetical protein
MDPAQRSAANCELSLLLHGGVFTTHVKRKLRLAEHSKAGSGQIADDHLPVKADFALRANTASAHFSGL